MTLPGVSKTALLTLRARAREHARARGVLVDPTAVAWSERAGWDARLDGWAAQPLSMALIAFRAHEIDLFTQLHLSRVSEPVVVELGCGFSTRYQRVQGERSALWLEVDLPELIRTRDELEPASAPRRTFAGSALATDWMGLVAGWAPEKILIVAEGLLYYLPEAEVDAWFLHLRERFPGASIVFDVVGARDFGALLENTRRVEAAISWKISPPFDRAHERFGIRLWPEASAEVSVKRWVDQYWPTLGWVAGFLARAISRNPAVLAERSGTLAGQLLPR